MSYQLVMKGPYNLFAEATEDTHIAMILSDQAPFYFPYTYPGERGLVSKRFGRIDLSEGVLWVGVSRDMFNVKSDEELMRDIQNKVRVLGGAADFVGGSSDQP